MVFIVTFRIYAVAVHGARSWGTGESHFVACLPIMLRPTLPRFLNYGDKRVQITTIVQNQTDRELQVTVVARGNNILFVEGQDRVEELGVTQVIVPANLREAVSFYVDAQLAGKAHVQILAAIDDLNNNNGNALHLNILTTSRSNSSRRLGNQEHSCVDPSNLRSFCHLRSPR
jgi:uncharacterized protein YfaS (alpha-2-macroglobulin family)